MKYALHLSFDGTPFWGWQKTGSGKSVEEALEQALTQIVQHPIQLEAASRLDRGVHARAQVAVFSTHKEIQELAHRANCLLPPEIRILKSAQVPDTFHPTLHAQKKEYRYYIDNSPIRSPFRRNYTWHIKDPLDLAAMQQAASQLVGAHDFQALCNQRKGLRYTHTQRTLLELSLSRSDTLIEVRILGDHFLYKMCRNLAGLLVGYGKHLPLLPIPDLLRQKDRKLSYVTAPACGLFLHEIYYEGL